MISVHVFDTGCFGRYEIPASSRNFTIDVPENTTLRELYLSAGLKCTKCRTCVEQQYIGVFYYPTPDTCIDDALVTSEMLDKTLDEIGSSRSKSLLIRFNRGDVDAGTVTKYGLMWA